MNDDSTQIKMLMDYVDGAMNADERSAFEQRLAGDEDLQKQVDSLQDMRDVVKRYGLEQKVAAVRAGMTSQQTLKPGIVRSITRNSLRIAAALIILIGIAGMYEYSNLSSSKIYNGIYEPYAASSMRGSSDSSAIIKAYNENKNDDVITIFNKQQEHHALDYFLTGNAYLKMDSGAEAVRSFESLLAKNSQNANHQYQEDAEYYLALSHLANKDIKKAIPLFQKIHDDKNHAYHDKVSAWFLLKLRWSH